MTAERDARVPLHRRRVPVVAVRVALAVLVTVNLATVALAFVDSMNLLLVVLVVAPLDVVVLAVAARRVGPRAGDRRAGAAGVVRVLVGLAGACWAGWTVLAEAGIAFVAVPLGSVALVLALFPRSAEAWRWCLRAALACLLAAVAVGAAGAWLSRDAIEPYGLFLGFAIGALFVGTGVAFAASGWLVAVLGARARVAP